MAGIKVDMEQQHHVIVESQEIEKEEEEEELKPQKTKRVASLDIFRGLTVVALMVLVDDAGGEWPMIGHAPWNGCNLADFVMPFFLFIVGMAIALALKRIPEKLVAIRKVILRTLKLLFWGLLLQGGYFHDLDKLKYSVDMNRKRLCGILQRIALAYLVVAIIEITTKTSPIQRTTNGMVLHFQVTQLAMNSDNVDFGKTLTATCNVRGNLDPPCNAVGYIDRQILGINHMYPRPTWKRSKACSKNSPYEGPFKDDAPSWCWAPFEPEGILIYVCVTSGAAALVFSAFYILWVILTDRYLESITFIHVWLGRDPSSSITPLMDLYSTCTKNSPYEEPFKDDAPSWCWAPFEPEGILRITRPDFFIGLAWA
ncbi:hypothetical protein KY290_037252 [Solanum tuberosum]|uniref:Heparan-alpha-glucosaminide N-acetyltransferase catalytic domain-containing protein n=1 Tax=Solanum tuberosum TaxID=4113 RepID=A0ABQ7TV07_SOLTU|nr:hypothetical protein KY285_037969 [Solanum tuberosum]KAH0738547.1 hypothetical protein KY290_037252 [Solanum tuberosum]